MSNKDLHLSVGRLAIWQKLLLIVVLMGSTVPIAVWQFVRIRNRDIANTRKEIYGTQYLQMLRKLGEQVIKHRGLTNSFLRGNRDIRDTITPVEKSISSAMQSLLETDGRVTDGTSFGVIFETADRVAALRKDWEALKLKSQSEATIQDIFAGHNALLDSTAALMIQVADRSGLTLDPALDTHYLVAIAVDGLPEALDGIDASRSIMTGAALTKTLPGDEQGTLNQESYRSALALNRIESAFRKAVEANAGTGADVVSQQQQLVSTAIRDSRTFISKSSGFSPAAANYDQLLQEGTKTLDRLYFVYDTSLNSLTELLNRRMTAIHEERNFFVVLIGTAFLLGILVSLVMARRINARFKEALAQRMGVEAATVNEEVIVPAGPIVIEVPSYSYQPALNTASNESLDLLRASIETMAAEMRAVVDGDLTGKAEGREECTKALAEGLNTLIDRMRCLVSRVQEVSSVVSRTADTTLERTDQLVNKVQNQSQQILRTANAIEEMTLSIKEVSEAVLVSSSVAQRSLQSARHGSQALEDNVRSMTRVRDHVVEASRQVRQLGDTTREITAIVELIDEIADKTSLLALNASIQAATAGDAGRGFAVVAEEIERLSERSTEATSRIARLLKSIQIGTEKAISAMEENTRDVIEGAGQACQASDVMNEFEGAAVHLSELIQTIARASRQQTAGSENLSEVITEVSQMIQETTAGIRQSANTVGNLSILADELRASVEVYKLPAQTSVAKR